MYQMPDRPFNALHSYASFLPQVTLEEQMICGALQTLNEEAMEDVLQSEPPSHPGEPLRTISELTPSTPDLPDTSDEEIKDHVIIHLPDGDDVFMWRNYFL